MKDVARRKQYVEVVATHYIDGSVRPQKIVLATGPVYEIEDSREAAPGKAHTTGELRPGAILVKSGEGDLSLRDQRAVVCGDESLVISPGFVPARCAG